VKYITEKVKK